MNFTGSVSYRPVRIGFLVADNDLSSVIRAARLSACLWGGRYNPIIPFFETGSDRWQIPHLSKQGLDIARGYVDFFEPDILVEGAPGMAEKLGWKVSENHFGMPNVISIDQYYELDYRNSVAFAAGIDILEVITELYDTEFRFERRHKQPFAKYDEATDDAFFDVVGGRYPADEPLQYIGAAYDEVFSPETLPPDVSTALRMMKEGLYGPFWITCHALNESLGSGRRDQTFYVFDPTNAGDAIDFWNFRLVESEVFPINVNWFLDLAPFIRDRIVEAHRPIPGNPSGIKFTSAVHFSSSIGDERQRNLTSEHLSGLPGGAFYRAQDPLFWAQRGRYRAERKILATGKAVSFDEDTKAQTSVKIPAPSPSFLNRSERYRRARWVNVIVPTNSFRGETPAIVYPSNLWSPGYPRLAAGDDFRVGREGWIVQSEYDLGYSLLTLETGRDAIVGWLKTKGIEAKPSEEGQIAAQVIAAAGGLRPSGMFADRATLELLRKMAESSSDVSRDGKRTEKAIPDRSMHVDMVRRHFDVREKRAFGYWNALDYFLERSVFRAGVRVQCPICGYRNWIDLDSLSYKPTCSRCLNEFKFSQRPSDLQKIEWYYRIIGPFAAPDYARGAYSVALTLRTLTKSHDAEMTWSTGLLLRELGCEVDFVAWHRGNRMLIADPDEPLLLVGEAKSFGHNAINDSSIAALMTVAERFPGAVMVVSTLRNGDGLSLAEVGRLRQLAIWGRRMLQEGQPINPLIMLTGTELFAEYSIEQAWKAVDGHRTPTFYDVRNLHTLAQLTVERYLGLGSPQNSKSTMRCLPEVESLLRQIRA